MFTSLNLFIAGEWRGSGGRDVEAVLNPATGRSVGELPHASAADLDAALEAAGNAFLKWRNASAVQRGAILKRAALLMRERNTEAQRLLATLPAPERDVLRRRGHGEKLAEIGAQLETANKVGVSRERVRQLESAALERLRGRARDVRL